MYSPDLHLVARRDTHTIEPAYMALPKTLISSAVYRAVATAFLVFFRITLLSLSIAKEPCPQGPNGRKVEIIRVFGGHWKKRHDLYRLPIWSKSKVVEKVAHFVNRQSLEI